MSNPTLLQMPLAVNGDKNTIPVETGSNTGLFSQKYGFQPINSLPLSAGGKAISRHDYNGAMFLLSNILFYAQKGYTFEFDSTQNYFVGCEVIDPADGNKYRCIADVAVEGSSPSEDTTHWERIFNESAFFYRMPNVTYVVGDVKYTANLPSWGFLTCVTGGVAGSGELVIPAGTKAGDTITDGQVVWRLDSLANMKKALAESTGFGIISGCEPTISGLTVTIGAGTVHLVDGTRKEIAETSVTLDAADSTNPRIDLVYITSDGTLAKITGTAAASPVVPALPSGGISVCNVTVTAGATTGTIANKRDMLPRYQNTGFVSAKDFGVVGDGVHDDTAALQAAIDNVDGKILILPKDATINVDIIFINGHHNFTIVGNNCVINANVLFNGCTNFKLISLHVRGENKYNTFRIQNCANFEVDSSYFEGLDYDSDGTSLEGLHILSSSQFKVTKNVVKNVRLDGILIHSNCSQFVVTDNLVTGAGAIGIEVEGRTGQSYDNPQMARCYDGLVANNIINNCADWALLCLFSYRINFIDNVGANNAGIGLMAGCNKVNFSHNTLSAYQKGLEINSEHFLYSVARNNSIVVNDNLLQGPPKKNSIYGWAGIVTVRFSSDVTISDNHINYLYSATEYYNDASYISIAESSRVSVEGNICSNDSYSEGHYFVFGVLLFDHSFDEVSNANISNGLEDIYIRNNNIRSVRDSISVDLAYASATNMIKNLKHIVIEGNSLKGIATNDSIGLALMYLDESCFIDLGKNYIDNQNANANFYLTKARIINSEHQVTDDGNLVIVPQSATAQYYVGDMILCNPNTAHYAQICTLSGTPGTWKYIDFAS
jgi:hypothetical protein